MPPYFSHMLVCIIDILSYLYLYAVGSSTFSGATLLIKTYILLSANGHAQKLQFVINLL